jgi:hypothetical protein
LRIVRSFLAERFGRGHLRLSVLCAADVIRFVQHEAAHLSPKVAKLVTTALRSFLRCARYRGYIAGDLAAAVPAVHVRVDERGWETERWPQPQATAPILDSTRSIADLPWIIP